MRINECNNIRSSQIEISTINNPLKYSPRQEIKTNQISIQLMKNFSDKVEKNYKKKKINIATNIYPSQNMDSLIKSPKNIFNSYIPGNNKGSKIQTPNKENPFYQLILKSPEGKPDNLTTYTTNFISKRHKHSTKELPIKKRKKSVDLKEYSTKKLSDPLQQIDEVNSLVGLSSNVTFTSLENKSDLISEKNDLFEHTHGLLNNNSLLADSYGNLENGNIEKNYIVEDNFIIKHDSAESITLEETPRQLTSTNKTLKSLKIEENKINGIYSSQSYQSLSTMGQTSSTQQSLDSSRLSILNESIISIKENLDNLKDPCPEIIKKLRIIHQTYEDNLFIPNITSLVNSAKKTKKEEWVQNIIWKRISQTFKSNYINLYDNIEPSIIKPGYFRNNYLLSSLAALAENPYNIIRLFGDQTYNEEGCYSIRICRDGLWKLNIIDDYIPILKNNVETPAFIGVNPTEQAISIWPILLEKAWAKAFDNYENIQYGDIANTLKEFTGAPSFEISVSNSQLWNEIVGGYQSKYIMVAMTDNKSIQESSLRGLNLNYGYAILGCCILSKSTGAKKLIQLRNNWENSVWEGEWKKDSLKWTAEIKKELQEHGINWNEPSAIWMTLTEFQKVFSSLIINKVNELHINSHITLRLNKNSHSITEFRIAQSTTGYFEITQIDQRLFRNSNIYQYSKNRLILFKKDGFIYKFVKGTASEQSKSTYMQVDLQPGEYFVFIFFDWNNEAYDFTLSFYGNTKIEWNRIRIKENPKLCNELWNNTIIARGTMNKNDKNSEWSHYTLKIDEAKMQLDLIVNQSKSLVLNLRRSICNMKINAYGYYIPDIDLLNLAKKNEDIESLDLCLEPETNQIIVFYQKDFNLPLKVEYFDS